MLLALLNPLFLLQITQEHPGAPLARAGHGEALLGSPLVPAVVAEELAGVVCPALVVLPHGLRDCTVASVAGVARGSHAVAKFTAVGSLCSS